MMASISNIWGRALKASADVTILLRYLRQNHLSTYTLYIDTAKAIFNFVAVCGPRSTLRHLNTYLHSQHHFRMLQFQLYWQVLFSSLKKNELK